MYNGLYVATGGMLAQSRRVDVLSNNLANINTSGYKKERPVFTLYRPLDTRIPQNLIRSSLYNKTINSTVRLDNVYTNYNLGTFQQTDNPLNIALGNKKAFFAVDTPFGVRYTRAGQFTFNSNGTLTTPDGFPVLTVNEATGAVDRFTLPSRDVSKFQVSSDGGIYVDGQRQAKFELSQFPDNKIDKLQKQGRNLYAAVDVLPQEIDSPDVKQGYVEGSNVNAVDEMVQMIDAQRSYDMYSKVIQTYDELDNSAATKIASQA